MVPLSHLARHSSRISLSSSLPRTHRTHLAVKVSMSQRSSPPSRSVTHARDAESLKDVSCSYQRHANHATDSQRRSISIEPWGLRRDGSAYMDSAR
eukprot:1526666-Rhodomonas_salina.3